jgi:O-antigen ligase
VIVESNVLDRITDPSIALGGADESANVRREAAKLGWQVFEEHPLFGGGVGATVDWDMSVSTHNIYIRDLAEYGIFGIALYPTLLILLVRGVTGPARYPLRAFAFVLALTGLFSHNVLDEWDVLLSIALAAVIAADARVHAPSAPTS